MIPLQFPNLSGHLDGECAGNREVLLEQAQYQFSQSFLQLLRTAWQDVDDCVNHVVVGASVTDNSLVEGEEPGLESPQRATDQVGGRSVRGQGEPSPIETRRQGLRVLDRDLWHADTFP
jgi:hypothetical protein